MNNIIISLIVLSLFMQYISVFIKFMMSDYKTRKQFYQDLIPFVAIIRCIICGLKTIRKEFKELN